LVAKCKRKSYPQTVEHLLRIGIGLLFAVGIQWFS